jgi:RNA polymerase subunit RPABC4/transcription elongation factor Spt4
VIDSRQFLQFVVDRSLGFDSNRPLGFDSDRSLLFDVDRDLSFDFRRNLGFGLHGPVFRGQACPNCKTLVSPHEGICRNCGTAVQAKLKAVAKRRTHRNEQQRSESMQICPNCSYKIPSDAVYCPRCRVKLDEWRDYIKRLREWEQEVAASRQSLTKHQSPQPNYTDDYYNVQSRRR